MGVGAILWEGDVDIFNFFICGFQISINCLLLKGAMISIFVNFFLCLFLISLIHPFFQFFKIAKNLLLFSFHRQDSLCNALCGAFMILHSLHSPHSLLTNHTLSLHFRTTALQMANQVLPNLRLTKWTFRKTQMWLHMPKMLFVCKSLFTLIMIIALKHQIVNQVFNEFVERFLHK